MDHYDLHFVPHLRKKPTRACHLWWVEPVALMMPHACSAQASMAFCAATGATLASFLAAVVHFGTEVLIFKTMSLKSAANPLIIAGRGTVLSHISVLTLHSIPFLCCTHLCQHAARLEDVVALQVCQHCGWGLDGIITCTTPTSLLSQSKPWTSSLHDVAFLEEVMMACYCYSNPVVAMHAACRRQTAYLRRSAKSRRPVKWSRGSSKGCLAQLRHVQALRLRFSVPGVPVGFFSFWEPANQLRLKCASCEFACVFRCTCLRRLVAPCRHMMHCCSIPAQPWLCGSALCCVGNSLLPWPWPQP